MTYSRSRMARKTMPFIDSVNTPFHSDAVFIPSAQDARVNCSAATRARQPWERTADAPGTRKLLLRLVAEKLIDEHSIDLCCEKRQRTATASSKCKLTYEDEPAKTAAGERKKNVKRRPRKHKQRTMQKSPNKYTRR